MENAREELLEAVKNTAKIKCARITIGYQYDEEDIVPEYVLKLNYSEKEYNDFLKSLNFEYDEGYGGQKLYGTVWLEDGTWLSRGEYDGSEWWEHNVLPDIHNKCLTI